MENGFYGCLILVSLHFLQDNFYQYDCTHNTCSTHSHISGTLLQSLVLTVSSGRLRHLEAQDSEKYGAPSCVFLLQNEAINELFTTELTKKILIL